MFQYLVSSADSGAGYFWWSFLFIFLFFSSMVGLSKYVPESWFKKYLVNLIAIFLVLSVVQLPVVFLYKRMNDGVVESDLFEISEDVQSMSEEELKGYLGQMFVVGDNYSFSGHAKESNMYELIRDLKVGGVLINKVNLKFSSNEKIKSSIGSVQDYIANLNKNSDVPLFVSTDHEGGNTSALSYYGLVNQLPSPMLVGATRDSKNAKIIGRISFQELSSLGVNVNFSPVVDVNTNKENDLIRDRSFGGASKIVSKMAAAYIESSGNYGVLPVVKHFPGHGGSKEGFHTSGIPKSSQSHRSFKTSLQPFRDLISKTENNVGVMTSHINIKVDGEDIGNTSLSKKIITDLLSSDKEVNVGRRAMRGLGSKSLVFTDDLTSPSGTSKKDDCKNNKENYAENVYRVLIKSFDAGHDVFVFSNILDFNLSSRDGCSYASISIDEFKDMFSRFSDYIFGENPERVDQYRQSLRKILLTKSKLSHLRASSRESVDNLFRLIGENYPEVRRISEDGVTYLSGSEFSVSLSDKLLVVPFIDGDYKYIEKVYRRGGDFREDLREDSWFSYLLNDRKDNVEIYPEKNSIFYSELIPQSKRLKKKISEVKPDKIIFQVRSRSSWLFVQTFLALYECEFDCDDILVVVSTSPTLLNTDVSSVLNDMGSTKANRKKIKNSDVMHSQLYGSKVVISYSNYGLVDEIVVDKIIDNSLLINDAEPSVRIEDFYPEMVTNVD